MSGPDGGACGAALLRHYFFHAARRHPDTPALELAGVRLSYRELADLAEAVAADLLALPGGPPRRVALLAGRGPAAYAGYLGVLRAGAAVVPLDPGGPAGRNGSMAAAGIDALVSDGTAAGQAEEIGSRTGSRRLDLTPAGEVTAPRAAGARPAAPIPPDALAYVLFTSGSTGGRRGCRSPTATSCRTSATTKDGAARDPTAGGRRAVS